MKHLTNIFCIQDGKVLLAMKKRGYGAGKWNGYGGKLDPGETVLEAAVREFHEESTVKIEPDQLVKVGEFTYLEQDDESLLVHAFLLHDLAEEPKETEEMAPQWFDLNALPLADMWDGDKYWLPLILQGKKIQGTFTFEGEVCVDHELGTM